MYETYHIAALCVIGFVFFLGGELETWLQKRVLKKQNSNKING